MFDMRIKQQFFDRKKVINAIDRTTRRALSRFGAYVRTRAKQSISSRGRQMRLDEMTTQQRRRYHIAVERAKQESRRKPRRPTAPSAPGKPPRSHTGLLKRFIFFGYEPRRRGVVIGPARLNQKAEVDGFTVPELLEEGGDVVVDGAHRHYAARPFMGPAFRKELPGLPQRWREAVR